MFYSGRAGNLRDHLKNHKNEEAQNEEGFFFNFFVTTFQIWSWDPFLP
jgi:hypothetical protein